MIYLLIDENSLVVSINEKTVDPIASQKAAIESIKKDTNLQSKLSEYNKHLSIKTKNINQIKLVKKIKEECDLIIKDHVSNSIKYISPATQDGSIVECNITKEHYFNLLKNKKQNQ